MRISGTRIRVLISAALLAAASLPLSAGVVFEVETTYSSGGRTESSQISVEEPNFKMEILPEKSEGNAQRDEAIFRGDRQQMMVVDHREKSYMVIDSEAVGRIGGQVQGQMQQAMKELEKSLEKMDPDQRAMVEKMMKERMPTGMPGLQAAQNQPVPKEFRRTSERATKNGYPCVRYEVIRGGERIQELWVTDWKNIKGSGELRGTFEEVADFYSDIMDSIRNISGGLGEGFINDANPLEAMKQVEGFPVVIRDFEGGELESETVLRSATEKDLGPDAFEPPKGYRLRALGMP